MEVKKACPDHYFLLLPDYIKLEEVPEDILLEAGWIKLSRIPDEIDREVLKSIIKKDNNIKILENFRDISNRGTGREPGK